MDASGQMLTAVFVDYESVYSSLRRANEDAARRFARDAGVWLAGLASGVLITSGRYASPGPRRILLNRCYGNPVPRRNASDNSTDMNSFPFVRHHFLRAGAEVIDCSPLSPQAEGAADIRMVMDVRDTIGQETYLDEFIILSGDSDFTPLLHRLRAHARRTVIYASDQTPSPYAAISDGEVREADLVRLLLGDAAAPAAIAPPPLQLPPALPPQAMAQAAPAPPPDPTPAQVRPATAATVQQMVARIYDACQAPPLSPPEYRLLFGVIAQEIAQRGVAGLQTIDNIVALAREHGVDVGRDEVRFVVGVVSEPDPWFQHGVSEDLFAARYRNFVLARCRSAGLALSSEAIELVDHWFAVAPTAAPG